jgi:hypothetical protein
MFNDEYGIDEQYQRIRKLLLEAEPDLYKFIGRTKNDTAAIRARKIFKEIEGLLVPLRKSMQLQRQDNKSKY